MPAIGARHTHREGLTARDREEVPKMSSAPILQPRTYAERTRCKAIFFVSTDGYNTVLSSIKAFGDLVND